MALEGPLQDIGIHDVFQLLDLTRKSGTLRVHSAARESEGHVYFHSGAVVHATMRDNPHSLGVLLLKAGKLSESQLREATSAQRRGDKRKLGEILVAQGTVTRRDVDRSMRLQIESVVFELFSWKEGTFSFTDGDAGNVDADAAIRVSTESLLMEGARRIDEWSRMADRLPDALVVPKLAALDDGPEPAIDLRPGEWEVLTMIDGERSVRDIASSLGVSEFDVARTIYGMMSTGLIIVAPREELVHG
ncbi:MAG: DUF4388 domain-containing protein [Gemmatimonadaceae bacterium]